MAPLKFLAWKVAYFSMSKAFTQLGEIYFECIVFSLFLNVYKCQLFFPILILIILMYFTWETSRNKLKSTLFWKLFLIFTVWINCSSDYKMVAHSRPFQLWISKVFLDTWINFSHGRLNKKNTYNYYSNVPTA